MRAIRPSPFYSLWLIQYSFGEQDVYRLKYLQKKACEGNPRIEAFSFIVMDVSVR